MAHSPLRKPAAPRPTTSSVCVRSPAITPRWKEEYQPAGKLADRIAMVTEGASSIGKAVAILYAKEGADVAITYRVGEFEAAKETLTEIERQGVRGAIYELEVSSPEDCELVVREAVEELGGVDILVNTPPPSFEATQASSDATQASSDATQASSEATQVDALSLEAWNQTFRSNLGGFFHMIRAVLPYLDDGANIINTGMDSGPTAKQRVDDAACQAAIQAFTKALSLSMMERNIRVNCVVIPSPSERDGQSKEIDWQPGESHIRDLVTPELEFDASSDLAPTYVYLASNGDSARTTGKIFAIE